MEEFRRIKRELVAKGAIIDYYQDTMQIPNGNIAKWDLIDHKGAAADAEKQHHQHSDGIKMPQRIERHPARIARGGIAEPRGNKRMRALVKGYCEQYARHAKQIYKKLFFTKHFSLRYCDTAVSI